MLLQQVGILRQKVFFFYLFFKIRTQVNQRKTQILKRPTLQRRSVPWASATAGRIYSLGTVKLQRKAVRRQRGWKETAENKERAAKSPREPIGCGSAASGQRDYAGKEGPSAHLCGGFHPRSRREARPPAMLTALNRQLVATRLSLKKRENQEADSTGRNHLHLTLLILHASKLTVKDPGSIKVIVPQDYMLNYREQMV